MERSLFEKALEMPPQERVAFAELILPYGHDESAGPWVEEVGSQMPVMEKPARHGH